jgi:hypothetical protein
MRAIRRPSLAYPDADPVVTPSGTVSLKYISSKSVLFMAAVPHGLRLGDTHYYAGLSFVEDDGTWTLHPRARIAPIVDGKAGEDASDAVQDVVKAIADHVFHHWLESRPDIAAAVVLCDAKGALYRAEIEAEQMEMQITRLRLSIPTLKSAVDAARAAAKSSARAVSRKRCA